MSNDLSELLRSVIREELAPVNERLDHADKQMGTVIEQLEKMDQRLERIEEDQHLIKKAVLDTNERVMKMETVLENQSRIIELLSARSIEQEAQLKRIK
ncbi:hypothetical protein KIH86_27440 [Paenibacillus sp. HN-1]|uniref:hypothetical protein n=1 Tax=Paenibacillus TaxID=44249 RepID=UPI001CA7FEC6|nr:MULTISPECIES: hypothetical protein [Paenibacillus]MBY9078439.1 hypothetical protein [Paenibacillus sp. CGMCC 1.18879]MBY9087929.1 hypothetical protein [Paenibacillus sinensis]